MLVAGIARGVSELRAGLVGEAAPVSRALMAALLGVIVIKDLMQYEVPRMLLGSPERLQFLPLPLLPTGDAWSALAFFLQVALNIAALCLISGRFARPGAAFAALVYGYLFLADRARYTNNGLLLLVLLLLAALESIDPERPAPQWPTWVGRCLVSGIYLIGATMKLMPHWLSGEILAAALATYGRDIYGAVFGWQLPLAFQALAIVSALVECFMVFGLWLPRLRRLAFVTGALFHLSIEAILPVRVFSFAMIAAYTLFLPAARLEVFVRARRERFLLTTVCGVLAAFAIHASLAWLLQNVSTPRRPQFALFLALGIFFGAVIAFPRWAAPSTGGRALVPVSLRVPLFTGLVLLQLWGALKPLFGYTNRFGWKMFTEVTRVGGAIEIERGGGWSEYEQSTWGNKLKPIWDSLSEQRDLMLGSAERVLADEPEATRARVRLRYEQNGERGEELIEVGR